MHMSSPGKHQTVRIDNRRSALDGTVYRIPDTRKVEVPVKAAQSPAPAGFIRAVVYIQFSDANA
jgi:hypothetical protein